MSILLTDSALKVYMKRMSDIEMLSADEEFAYAKAAKAGDVDAKKQLVEHNWRLVISIAKKYQNMGMPLIDLIQEGNIGLMKAADKFDYELGNRFSTFATYWIRQAISRALADQGRIIRVPAHLVEMINKVKKVQRELTTELGREPTVEELAASANITIDQAKEALDLMIDAGSLDMKIGDTEDDATLEDLIPDTKLESPQDRINKLSNKEIIEAVLSTLTDRESSILKYRFGLDGKQPKTLKETGDLLGLSTERIRQLEEHALRKLRHPMRAEMLKEIQRA